MNIKFGGQLKKELNDIVKRREFMRRRTQSSDSKRFSLDSLEDMPKRQSSPTALGIAFPPQAK
jgi:hypothetical protein